MVLGRDGKRYVCGDIRLCGRRFHVEPAPESNASYPSRSPAFVFPLENEISVTGFNALAITLFYSLLTNSVVSILPVQFGHNPSPFAVNKGIGTFSSIFDLLGRQKNHPFSLFGGLLYLRQLILVSFGLPFNGLQGSVCGSHANNSYSQQDGGEYQSKTVHPIAHYRHGGKFSDSYGFLYILTALVGVCVLIWRGADCLHDGRPLIGWFLISVGICLDGLAFASVGIGCLPWNWWNCLHDGEHHSQREIFHNGQIVPRKYLTSNSYWGTVIGMANVLNTDKQIAVIGSLAEGSSIRSIERITGVHRDTIMRLGVKVGQGCAKMMDSAMRDLPCTRLEMDEIWGFVGKKDRNVREGEDAVGSVWTFCAIDAETKLVPAFKVGKRDAATAKAFVQDVADRMAYRVQISTDGLTAYVPAMESAFGGNVDYAQIVKVYGYEEVSNNRRYSAPEFVSSEKKVVVGNPDPRLISTSYIERLNATTRLHMRRLTRLTLAFSKKRENFEAAVGLHFAYYNFVKRHSTLRCTPAMAAGITGTFWGVGDLLEAAA
jgi:IS1 family transposase